jgi:hypothetical protein
VLKSAQLPFRLDIKVVPSGYVRDLHLVLVPSNLVLTPRLMNFVNAVLFLALSCPAHGSAQTTTFNRVRYQGGTIPSKISPEEIRNN